MKISKLIKLLKTEIAISGDMEIFIYDRHGDRINPKALHVGCINRSGKTSEFAYISDLK
jgi:hypothetical protein